MTLVLALLRRRILDVIRYPVEWLTGIVVLYAIFLMLFLGAKTFGGDAIQSRAALSALVVGYVVFMLTQQAYQSFSNQIFQESTTGTLEQLALSPYGLLRVMLVDFLAQSVVAVFQLGIVILPIMATTGLWLHFDIISVAVLLGLTMTGVLGLGLGLGSLAMVFKRIGGVVGLLGLSFMLLVAAPVDRYPVLKLLPVAHGNFELRQVLVGRSSIFARPRELAILFGVSSVYVLLGMVAFRFMDARARERGLLGQY